MMAYCGTGQILRIDLNRQAVRVEDLSADLYRMYPGGKALAGYYLVKELAAGVAPLGPENLLVLANGLLTGLPLATATRFTAAARSPLTGAYGESEAGGYWGPELRMAGFEAVLITGRAERPVYLWIQDGQAEIREADHLWGKEPEQAQALIRQESGDERIRVLQIGLGGENLVRYAGLTNELRHFNGRTGMGAVMGSKRLKAIAVRGHQRVLEGAFDPQKVSELGKALARVVKDHPQSWDLYDKGTPGLVAGLNAGGILPTRNFLEGAFEQVDKIKWDVYEKELLTARRSCYACAVRCKREVALNDRYQVSSAYGGPEYETVAGFTSNCGIGDLQAAAKANELCNRFTLDSISTSAVVAFAMECFEHGLIGLEETGGIELRFGNAEAMLQIVEMIAHRKGLGDLLAEGSARTAQVIGGEAPYFAMHVKGQELPMHEPRGKFNVGLGYAVSETGADHLVGIHDTMVQNPSSVPFQGAQDLGITQALPARDSSRAKVQQYFVFENWVSAGKVIGSCYFGPAPRSFIKVEDVISAVNANTGWDLALGDLLKIGERATNLARVFNMREGFSRQDDSLPERMFTQLKAGALSGVALSRDELERALTEVYRIKGWNAETGAPTAERLEQLGLGWAVEGKEAID